MAKYLFTASYTAAGAKGVLSEGGTSRQKAVERLVKSVGGKVEAMYWAFGAHDFYMIADMPDAAAAAALSLTVSSTGTVAASTTVLLTAADLDAAAKTNAQYRAPGAKSK
ncbi:MAG TPA: GYD domain-containing protein [Candidatus Limnocylindrales bacterium]|jgi:uncharacterized protein with GYD domain